MNNIKKLVCFSLLTVAFISALKAQSTSGTMSDMDGLPLPGATVINLNTSNGVTTDFDGKFSIETSANDVLQFTYVGYKSVEIIISESNDDLNIQLEQGNELEEVVGVGVYFEFHLFGYDIDMDSTFFLLDSSYDYPDWFSLEHNPDRLVGSANTDGMFHFPILLSDGQETVADTFRLSAHYFEPRISSISDIPNDQGERVYLTFQKSFFKFIV